MTQYDTSNVKLSNSRLKKLKSEIRNGNSKSEATLNFSSNAVGESNDEINFLYNYY